VSPTESGNQNAVDAAYWQKDTLDVFQSTLSCVYETSEYVGGVLKNTFKDSSWTMLDIGGAEGVFTSNMLKQVPKLQLPNQVILVEKSQESSDQYKELLNGEFPQLSIRTEVKGIEDIVDTLPEANFVLASHSLYWVLDWNIQRGSVISRLLEKVSEGLCLIILASKDSRAYELKGEVLKELGVVDRSSFGEKVLSLIPPGFEVASETRDSFMDVSSLIRNDELMMPWFAYFCRVDPVQLRPHARYLRNAMERSALRVCTLPSDLQRRVLTGGLKVNGVLTKDSRILLHKECLITVRRVVAYSDQRVPTPSLQKR